MKGNKYTLLLGPLAFGFGMLLGRSPFAEPGRVALHKAMDRPTINRYMKSHTIRKLQIGAGGNDPDGWLNSDIAPASNEVYLDATRPFPFPDKSFQYVFSEHVIEHLTWEGGVSMLKECHRILAPGGTLRTVTPDLQKFLDVVEHGATPEEQRIMAIKFRLHLWPATPIPEVYMLNAEARDWGHQFLYDSASLRKSLEAAGFQQITQYPIEQETDPVFREAERRARDPGSDLWQVGNWEAMSIEAKP